MHNVYGFREGIVMFWFVYILVCTCELCLDIVFCIEYYTYKSSNPLFIIILTIIFFIMYVFCFPTLLFTTKGYGLVTGVPANDSLAKLTYLPTFISFVLVVLFILIPWGRIFVFFGNRF